MVRREDVAHAVADAALQVPGVARLGSGDGFVEVSTQYPGGKVVGVRLTDATAEVHIIAGRTPLPALARDVRSAVVAVLAAAGRAEHVSVVIDDIEDGAAERRGAGRAEAQAAVPADRRATGLSPTDRPPMGPGPTDRRRMEPP